MITLYSDDTTPQKNENKINPSNSAYYDVIADGLPYISVSEKSGRATHKRHKSLISARKAARTCVLEKKDGEWVRA